MKITQAKQISKELKIVYSMKYGNGRALLVCKLKNGKDVTEAVDTTIHTGNRKNAKAIFNLVVNNEVSPCHIKDVLTDLCVEYLNNR